MKRIAQEQPLQVEESFASAQRAVLVASNTGTPEEREAAWAVRKQYVIDQRAERGQVGPMSPAALKQLEVGHCGRYRSSQRNSMWMCHWILVEGMDYHRQSTIHKGIHMRRSAPVGHSTHQPVRRVASAAQHVASEVQGSSNSLDNGCGGRFARE